MLRWLFIVAGILAVPILPFLIFHDVVEQWLARVVESPPGPSTVVLLVVGLLGTDVLLPVPSSLVSTLAGSQLPTWLATLTSWVGLNLGAGFGFWVSRVWGRPLAERLSDPEDLARVERISARYAEAALVLTRALPILAEAMVLLLGLQRLPWRRFWPPVLLSNLGIALAYSCLGHYASQHEWLPLALSVSVALPLLATWGLRSHLKSREKVREE